MKDSRELALASWLVATLGEEVELESLAGDASRRRYFRLRHRGKRLIAMDSPPDYQDTRPFVDIADRLLQAGLNVPVIQAANVQEGFLLLTDLGVDTYLQVLTPANADDYFAPVIQTLVKMQQATRCEGVPRYDQARLRAELELFPDWYLARHLHMPVSAEVHGPLSKLFAQLLEQILGQATTFVHRDFMPRNLVVSAPGPGVIDFQDAVIGPVSYDIACLFRDAFVSWPWAQVERWQRQYWQAARAAGIRVPDSAAEFLRDCDYMAIQRHLKVIGIFARICYRDGKPHYLQDVPRFFGYLREALFRNPELTPLADVLRQLGELEAPTWS